MIIDINGNELINPDLSRGYLTDDTIVIHHNEVKAVQEVFHYETIAEYENGGKDVRKVIDVEGIEAHPAYDEKVPVQRYIEYTEEEMATREEAQNEPSIEDRVSALESAMIDMMMGGIE